MADIFWPLTVLTLRFKVSATCIIDSPRMKWRSTSNSFGRQAVDAFADEFAARVHGAIAQETGRVVPAAALQCAQRGHDLGEVVALEHHGGDAGVIERRDDHGVGHHGQHQDLDLGVVPHQVLDQAHAVAVGIVARHRIVGDDDVRRVLRQVPDQVGRAGQGADDVETQVLFQEVAHAHQNERVVVRQDNSKSIHVEKGVDSAGLSYYRAFCISQILGPGNFRSSCISLAASWRAFRFALSRLRTSGWSSARTTEVYPCGKRGQIVRG